MVDVVVSTKDGWGDGYHPTTSLSLEFLAKNVDPAKPQMLLDYGTGSGVLGIAACKLGCKSVIGIDIDDEALEEVSDGYIYVFVHVSRYLCRVCWRFGR